jgi:hypothetical protein
VRDAGRKWFRAGDTDRQQVGGVARAATLEGRGHGARYRQAVVVEPLQQAPLAERPGAIGALPDEQVVDQTPGQSAAMIVAQRPVLVVGAQEYHGAATAHRRLQHPPCVGPVALCE